MRRNCLRPGSVRLTALGKRRSISGSRAFPPSDNFSEWAAFRVAQLRCCRIGIAYHYSRLKNRGVTEAKLNRLADWQESRLFDHREQIALALAEALTLRPEELASRGLLEYSREVFDRDTMASLIGNILAVNEWNDLSQDF